MLRAVNMIGVRTTVTFLRRLGVALIIFPELITTLLGTTLVLVAQYLSRKHEANVNNRLLETVRYYLAHTSRFGDYLDGKFRDPGPVKHRGLNEEHPILGQVTGSRSSQANPRPSVWQNRHDMHPHTVSFADDMQRLSRGHKPGDSRSDASTITRKVIHHTINMEWLSRRYEGATSTVAHSSWATTSGAPQGVTHHSISTGLFSQHCTTGNIGQTKAKCHTMNTTLLRQRYGLPATRTTVVRAIQNNNYYYDMLSRKNVIGGF